MKANELRRLNLVEISEAEKIRLEEESEIINIWEVDEIKEGEISIYNKIENIYETFDFKSIKPIPLNEEWLLKFGFIFFYSNPRLESFFYNIQSYHPFNLKIDRDGDVMFNELNIKYVHQLQNLYFALIMEEL